MMKIEADLHTHTISSGHAYSTVDELAKTAAGKGLKLIAITDHGPNLPGGPHNYYFGNLNVIPRKLHGVRVLKGVEANILDNGKLDLPDKRLDTLELVAAGLHRDTGHNLVTKEDFTEATIKAIENPRVKMITHPANLSFPLDLKRVVKAAAENDVILELNASSFKEDKIGKRGDFKLSITLARLAKKYHVPLSLNTDAHFHTEVGDISTLDYIIKKTGLKNKDVINTSSKRVLDYIFHHRETKRKIV